jgi:hypothetical protein
MSMGYRDDAVPCTERSSDPACDDEDERTGTWVGCAMDVSSC